MLSLSQVITTSGLPSLKKLLSLLSLQLGNQLPLDVLLYTMVIKHIRFSCLLSKFLNRTLNSGVEAALLHFHMLKVLFLIAQLLVSLKLPQRRPIVDGVAGAGLVLLDLAVMNYRSEGALAQLLLFLQLLCSQVLLLSPFSIFCVLGM